MIRGINESDIYVDDPLSHIWQPTYDYLHAQFPNVKYADKSSQYTSLGRTTIHPSLQDAIVYSDKGTIMPDAVSDAMYAEMEDADYLINMASLKAHARAGISLTAKNHFGSTTRDGAGHLHPALPAPENDQPMLQTPDTENTGYLLI